MEKDKLFNELQNKTTEALLTLVEMYQLRKINPFNRESRSWSDDNYYCWNDLISDQEEKIIELRTQQFDIIDKNIIEDLIGNPRICIYSLSDIENTIKEDPLENRVNFWVEKLIKSGRLENYAKPITFKAFIKPICYEEIHLVDEE